MAMNPATLQVLIERAAGASQDAQALLGRLRRTEEQARKHLETLRQYLSEYEERGRPHSGDERDPSAEHNFAAFLGRLQQAIDAQEKEVHVREGATAAGTQEVSRCLQRQKSLEALDQRRIAAQRLVQTRRDQKSTDEYAQRRRDGAGFEQNNDSGMAARGQW